MSGEMRSTSPRSHDPYQALRFRDFRLLLGGNLTSAMGRQMLSLAIGWELYNRTNSALVLGIVGLVQVLPVLVFALFAGHVADRYDRKTVIIAAQSIIAVASLGLTTLSYERGSLAAIYGCLVLVGIGSTFGGPSSRALIADVVPEEAFENSATWSSSSTQLAAVVGPALGGGIIALFGGATLVYVLTALAAVTYVTLLSFVQGRATPHRQVAKKSGAAPLRSLGEGIVFLRKTPILLAAITLDLFAVLFGGAVTLLPIYARDILQVGPAGLGWLQAASSIGALSMAFALAHRPPLQRAGPMLLVAVIVFGAATIAFGLSKSFWFSLLMLFILGSMDNISVVVRSTLALTRTPREMRGRVAAISSLFISTSNQLGGFESGVTAQIFGPVASVVGGGVITILVVLIISAVWPELPRMRTLREHPSEVGAV